MAFVILHNCPAMVLMINLLELLYSEVKRNLNDTSALVSKRRKLPCSALDVWRHNRSRQNERILHESLLSGETTHPPHTPTHTPQLKLSSFIVMLQTV